MGALSAANIKLVYHYTPLHYFPFICRAGALLGKPKIAETGFSASHFRSMSHRHDVTRGFGAYSFLTTHPAPPILKAKLSAGFPHVSLVIPAEAVEGGPFDLCRFNVAMTRRLRRFGKPGFQESPTNGRYYAGFEIPIARTAADKAAMLDWFRQTDTMIEVLVPGALLLPDITAVCCFAESDRVLVDRVLKVTSVKWASERRAAPCPYKPRALYTHQVVEFVEKALADPGWRGDGLEFDKV